MSSTERLATITSHMSASNGEANVSIFSNISLAPTDPLFGLMAAYKADASPQKVDLGIGAYRDDNQKPWVLPVVRKAEKTILNDPEVNHEYLPIAGLSTFTSAAAKLIFGKDSPVITEKRVSSLQTISGTGAVHLGALFLSKFYFHNPQTSGPYSVYLSSPTWANHPQIFSNVSLPIASYPYFDATTKGLDFENMCSTIERAPERSIILLHACAHNPTGVDPTREQWAQLATIIQKKKHFPFFDCAYQGFASGSLADDAWPIRHFASLGFEMCVAQSFSKNLGLYSQRTGCFHFVSSSADLAIRISSQLSILQRSEISNPPSYGARIASLVLNNPALFDEWEGNLQTMSGRIKSMRQTLYDKLQELGTPGKWEHIINQIGMFSFTGLNKEQVDRLIKEGHVYLTGNGRISMAGLNSGNVDYFARMVDKVVRESQ